LAWWILGFTTVTKSTTKGVIGMTVVLDKPLVVVSNLKKFVKENGGDSVSRVSEDYVVSLNRRIAEMVLSDIAACSAKTLKG